MYIIWFTKSQKQNTKFLTFWLLPSIIQFELDLCIKMFAKMRNKLFSHKNLFIYIYWNFATHYNIYLLKQCKKYITETINYLCTFSLYIKKLWYFFRDIFDRYRTVSTSLQIFWLFFWEKLCGKDLKQFLMGQLDRTVFIETWYSGFFKISK